MARHVHARMSSYSRRHAPCTHRRTQKHYSVHLREAKARKCTRCFQLLLRLFSFSSFTPSPPLTTEKGLGQQESTAQKTPHISASHCQITVPSPKRRRLKEEKHSVFSLLLLLLFFWLGLFRLSEKLMLALAGHYRHETLRPLSNAALCETADMPTYANSPRGRRTAQTETHKQFHKEKTARFSHDSAVKVKGSIDRGDSVGWEIICLR